MNPKKPPSSSQRNPAVKPASSTRLRPPHMPRRGTPEEEEGPQNVSSGEDRDISQIRRKVGSVPLTPRGLSLRWKIVLGMASITVATALLIFVVVYTKAVGQLDNEIDAKGVRLVKTLATIDAPYWHYAIYQDKADRKLRLDRLLQRLFGPNWGDATRSEVLRNADLRKLYETVTDRLGVEKREAGQRLTQGILDLLGSAPDLPDAARQRLTSAYHATLKDAQFAAEFQTLVDPLGAALNPLKSDVKDVGAGHDILNITVQDTSTSEAPGVQAVESERSQTIRFEKASSRTVGGVSVSDGLETNSGTAVRLYSQERKFGDAMKLRYNVILSLAHINDAKSSLMLYVLLPIFVAVLLGTGIAIWISTLITEPIKTLMADIQEVSSGNLAHQTAVTSTDEVGLLASTFNRMTQALKGAHDQELQTRALEHDLAIASEIQSNLVPKRMLKIPGYDVSAYYRPSKEVGGDYYDFIEIDEHNEGIIVADVSGKGIPGSLVMTMARAFIRMEAERSRNTSPGDTLSKANRMLAQDIKKGMFVTAMYAILDKRTNELKVASAGHNPMVVWRASSNQVQLVNPNGIALGFDKGPVFERTVKEERIALGRGDRIVMYTDGTVEAMNEANQEFGDDKFFGLVKQLATRDSNQMLNLLVKSLDEHKGNAPQSDDITIVTLRYL
ncbi:MAG TPA: SpoIIE family protein phosphatase [Planctomycetota bacterium]|nr:SpoIIE family protein phosphatase [Planctomycetota bacterium]